MVKIVQNIAVFILGSVFLLSATGIVVFQAHCSCSGNEQVSVYVSPKTCEEDFHANHNLEVSREGADTVKHDCSECTAHTDECGCRSLNVNFLKLDNQVVSEKVRLAKIQLAKIKTFEKASTIPAFFIENITYTESNFIDDPPQLLQSSSDFLIFIRQLKIPDLA